MQTFFFVSALCASRRGCPGTGSWVRVKHRRSQIACRKTQQRMRSNVTCSPLGQLWTSLSGSARVRTSSGTTHGFSGFAQVVAAIPHAFPGCRWWRQHRWRRRGVTTTTDTAVGVREIVCFRPRSNWSVTALMKFLLTTASSHRPDPVSGAKSPANVTRIHGSRHGPET
jgi:hypothetical protein